MAKPTTAVSRTSMIPMANLPAPEGSLFFVQLAPRLITDNQRYAAAKR